MTHGIVRTGQGGTTAAARTQIGADIILPAGGPWIISGFYGQLAKITTVPDEGAGGFIEMFASSGDLQPQPAPANFPLIGPSISESVNVAVSAQPLQIWPVNYTAPGKATIQLFYTQDQAITTGSRIITGIIFGEEVPVKRPSPFCATIASEFASGTEQNFGTITLSENASRIVGILADLNKADAATVAQECAATVRLASDSMTLQPAQFPCNRAFNASDGTAVGQSATPFSEIIPLDIPVIGGAIITVFATTTRSVTGNASLRVFLFYE